MRNSKLFFLGCLLFLSAWLAFSLPSRQSKQDETEPAPKTNRLVRMELLVFPDNKPLQSRRNIFTTRISGQLGSGIQNISGMKDSSANIAVPPQDPAPKSVDIRYMGYVKSGPKITALIVFQGEPLAVEQGEIIALGVQIVSISKEQIEVRGPDNEIRKFPLEGDLP